MLLAFTSIEAERSFLRPESSELVAYRYRLSLIPSIRRPRSVIVLLLLSVFVTYADRVPFVLSSTSPMSVTVPFRLSTLLAYIPTRSFVCSSLVDISTRKSSSGRLVSSRL